MSQSPYAGSAETAPAVPAEPAPSPPPSPRRSRTPLGGGGALPGRKRFGPENVFRALTTGSGATVLIIIVAIAIFLVVKAIPAIQADKANFLTFKDWFPDDPDNPRFGIAALASGTVVCSIVALAVAVPVSIGIALCLTHYAPRRLATSLGFLIDLLAAVPSIVFGLWGRDYFFYPVRDFSAWLHRYRSEERRVGKECRSRWS